MARSMSIDQQKPVAARVLTLEVLGSERIAPSFQRVTVGGEALEHFAPMGFDQWFRLFMPHRGQSGFRLPTRSSDLWYAQWLLTPPSRRPGCRNYTVRSVDVERGELEIDFVVHRAPGASEPEGIAAPWALSARPGDPLGLLDQGIMYTPHAGTTRTLIVSDESGLPAVEGILRSLPADTSGDALIEVPEDGDRRELAGPEGMAVHWLVRGDAHVVPGAHALAAAQELPVPAAAGYAFAVGESALVTGVRRHLVANGMPKENVRFCGYWKNGQRGR